MITLIASAQKIMTAHFRLTCRPISILTLAIMLSSSIFAQSSFELDNSEIDDLLDDQSIFELQAPVPNQTTCFETASIVSLLTPPSPFSILNILKEDIYKHTTSPVTRRSLLDLPSLTPDYFYNNYATFTAEAFFNYTPRVYFTKNSSFLRDYIDLANETIINELRMILETARELVEFDIPDDVGRILSLFSNIKLQQYRAGIMFGFARQYNNWLIAARMPLYYLLENFFLTDREIAAIRDNPLFRSDDAGFGVSADDESRRFGLKHLVSDRFGTGDTRLSLLMHPVQQCKQDVWFGLQATIPTAHAITKGLIGGEFTPNMPIPPFNLQHIFNLSQCNTNKKLAEATLTREFAAFLIEVLDRLSTVLINAPLGNGKHFGLGPEVDWRYHVNEYYTFHTYSSLQVYTPKDEDRFFLIEKQNSDFDRPWDNGELAGENLAVLNRLIVQTLFPIGIRTTIRPGMRFQVNSMLMYKSEHLDAHFGLDYWIQGSEKQQTLLQHIPFNLPIQRSKAARATAYQAKVFVCAGYYGTIDRSSCDTDWFIQFNGDATILNRGIGHNYTIGIRAGFEF